MPSEVRRAHCTWLQVTEVEIRLVAEIDASHTRGRGAPFDQHSIVPFEVYPKKKEMCA